MIYIFGRLGVGWFLTPEFCVWPALLVSREEEYNGAWFLTLRWFNIGAGLSWWPKEARDG